MNHREGTLRNRAAMRNRKSLHKHPQLPMPQVALLGDLDGLVQPTEKNREIWGREGKRRRGFHVSVCVTVLHLLSSVVKLVIITFCCLAINSVIP